MYVVTGQILTHDGDWHGSVSVPTFYLDPRVQGITSVAAAVIIARAVVNPLGTIPVRDIDLAVYEVPAVADGPSALQRAEHDAMGRDHDRWCAGAMLH
jgi:hypothetical protein